MDELSSVSADAPAATGRVHVRTVAITVLTSAVSLLALRLGARWLAPMLVSVLLAYALEPIVALLTRCRLTRGCAIIVLSVSLLATVAATGRMARHRVAGFIQTLPATARDLTQSIEDARRGADAPTAPGPLEHLQHAAIDLEATLGEKGGPRAGGIRRVVAVSAPFNLRGYLAGSLPAVAGIVAQLSAIGLLTLLLLLTGETLKRKLIAIAGPRARQKVTHDVIKAIDRQIERYLVARVLISAIVAGATGLGLWALGIRDALLLGVIAGLLNVMPFIGPAAAVALIAVAAFVQFHTMGMAVWATVIAGAIAALEGNVISPWLTGRAGELNTVAVFVSVLFWGWLWDVWGLVLAIPIMVAIKAAADHIEPLQPLGELLGR
ncbi:MAG: hypothetical protein JWL71_4651 [Acidobacteria bacterium]|nr:hypothetical protein [Acidobacteriota bacterium]